MDYTIKSVTDLSETEINTILYHWNIKEWTAMSKEAFRKKFAGSEFHQLTDDNLQLLCLARINFDFKVSIQHVIYPVAELVGLVAVQKRKGYGRKLMHLLVEDLRKRTIEAIGFCEKPLRSFYEQCPVLMMPGKAKHLREKDGEDWLVPTDDDILNLSLSAGTTAVFESLSSDTIGYLLFD